MTLIGKQSKNVVKMKQSFELKHLNEQKKKTESSRKANYTINAQ